MKVKKYNSGFPGDNLRGNTRIDRHGYEARQPMSFMRHGSFKSKTISFLFGAIAMTGCTLLPVGQNQLHAASDQSVPSDDPSQLMYELMIAELAGRRGYVDIATEGYFNAAQRTSDPRVSERATKLAVYGRQWQKAEAAGIRWAELEPDNSEVHQLLAQVHMRQGDSASAIEELDLLIKTVNTDSSVSMSDIYTFLLREPNRSIAVETMTGLRDKYPDDAYANLALAQLAFVSRDRETALTAVDRSIELNADNNEARLLRVQILAASGDTEQGFEELRDALKSDPENLELRLGYARLLVSAGRYDAASTEFEEIYSRGSDNASAVFTIGLLALESRRNSAAEKYFNQLLDLGVYPDEAHYYLGRIADSQQDYEPAIDHYEQVKVGESYLDAQIRAAELYGITGELSLARDRLQQLSHDNPNPEIHQRIIRAEGRILVESGKSEEAVEVLTGGLEQFPNDADMRYSRALAAERAGDKTLFESDLRALIEAEPENAHALNALGYYFADENIKLDEAEEFLVKANRLLPQDPAILDSLGWLRYRRGETEESLTLLRRAYMILNDAEIAAHLGEVLWVSGQQESAKEVWNKALVESPGDTRLKSVMERFIR